jgi:hypothetical protein
VATRSGKIVDRKDDKDVAAVLAKDEITDLPEHLALLIGYRLQLERFGTVTPGDLFDVQRSEADFLCGRTIRRQQ